MSLFLKQNINFPSLFRLFVYLYGVIFASVVFSGENSDKMVTEIKKILNQTPFIDKTLKAEKKDITDLESRLGVHKSTQKKFDSKINVYTIELTTLGSQLHLPDVELKLIEKAYMSCQSSMVTISNDLSKLKQENKQLKEMEDLSYEQKLVNDKLLAEIAHDSFIQAHEELQDDDGKGDKGDKGKEGTEEGIENGGKPTSKVKGEEIQQARDEADTQGEKKISEPADDPQQSIIVQQRSLDHLKDRLKRLQTLLTRKMLTIQSTDDFVKEKITTLGEIRSKYKKLMKDLEIRIKDARKAKLLTRKKNPLTQGTWQRMDEDIKELLTIFDTMFQSKVWKNSFSFLWLSGIHKLLSFFVILLMLFIFALKTRSFLKNILTSPHLEHAYWSVLSIKIAHKHLIIFSITAFLYLCINLKLFFNYATTANLIVEILMILTFVLWLIHFFELIQEKYQAIPAGELIFFLKALNLLAMISIMLTHVLKSDSSVIIIYRLLCEFLFYGWILYFLNKLLPFTETILEIENKTARMLIGAGKNCIMLIAVVGIILELAGYGTLAIYWYTSWGKTIMVLMWSGLIIGASGEWIPGSGPKADTASDTLPQEQAGPVGEISMLWLIKQLCFVMLFFLASIALFLSWGSSEYLFPRLFMMLTYSFSIGSMSFSLASLAQAIIILITTHYIARVWGHFFKKNFLGESGLDRGVQESMTTITVYSIWIFGIFIAMIVFGLNTTTLTVAFGALGIGIGFGLQNIFNNFISGIILLFERPIQVGDDIEINGTWATIRKTNVRSTVVQTYDNATIMIPNSELISNQVINWSFKDKRLRRKVTVGVAYDSDVELVRETLLEIAQKTPRVMSYPAPDVLFNDFGDSALIFTLRFWTFISCFMAVETEIRFQVEKLFRERGLVIAYPQQDIHIKSIPPEWLKHSSVPQGLKS